MKIQVNYKWASYLIKVGYASWMVEADVSGYPTFVRLPYFIKMAFRQNDLLLVADTSRPKHLFEQSLLSLLRVQKHWCSCRKLPSVQFCRWICLSDLRADFHLNYDMEFSPFPFPLFSGLALSGWAGSVSQIAKTSPQ